jgi:hypothetical protein
MAYSTKSPPLRSILSGQTITPQNSVTFWTYTSATDSLATVSAAGYFTDALTRGIEAGDFMTVFDVTANAVGCYIVSSFTGNAANLSSLGGGGTARLISTGTTDTASSSDGVIGWKSATAGAKTQTIPAATVSQTLTIKDAKGTSATDSISIIPLSGTIDNAANYLLNVNFGSVTLVADGVSNWMVI